MGSEVPFRTSGTVDRTTCENKAMVISRLNNKIIDNRVSKAVIY
jgi:hypothetical protein